MPGQLRALSPDQTRSFGSRLAPVLVPGDVITLRGPFGAGKTTLVQGIGRGLGIREPLASPSFALVNEYLPAETGSRIPFFHLDLYRLNGLGEVLDIGIDEYLARGGALAVEWPAVAEAALPIDHLDVTLRIDGDSRLIEPTARGPRSRVLLAALTSDDNAPGDR